MTTARTKKTVSFDPRLAQENIDPRPEQKEASAVSKSQKDPLKATYKALKKLTLPAIQEELRQRGVSEEKITRFVAKKWLAVKAELRQRVQKTAEEVIAADQQPAAQTRKRKTASSSDAGLFKPAPRRADTSSASPLKKVRVRGLR